MCVYVDIITCIFDCICVNMTLSYVSTIDIFIDRVDQLLSVILFTLDIILYYVFISQTLLYEHHDDAYRIIATYSLLSNIS